MASRPWHVELLAQYVEDRLNPGVITRSRDPQWVSVASFGSELAAQGRMATLERENPTIRYRVNPHA